MNFRSWLEMSLRATPGEETITLYRGDSTAIKSFSLSKTDPNALFGQGIYLTDNIRLARDYTTKGAGYDQGVIGRYRYRTIADATEAFISNMARHIDENGKDSIWEIPLPSFSDDPIRLKRLELARQKWEAMKKDVEIRKLTDGDIIFRKKQNAAQVSKYAVPKSLIAQMLDADEEIPDNVASLLSNVLSRLGDTGRAREVWQKNEDGYRSTFRNVYRAAVEDLPNPAEFQLQMRRGLKSLGYTGIRYQGGVTVGNIRHEAYVVWDEQGLDRMKVS